MMMVMVDWVVLGISVMVAAFVGCYVLIHVADRIADDSWENVTHAVSLIKSNLQDLNDTLHVMRLYIEYRQGGNIEL